MYHFEQTTHWDFHPPPHGEDDIRTAMSHYKKPIYGINVIEDWTAAYCKKNIKTQMVGDTPIPAIKVAVTEELPPTGATLVTNQADLNSIGAMAVLSIRAEGNDLAPAMERIEKIVKAYEFARRPWSEICSSAFCTMHWDEGFPSLFAMKGIPRSQISTGDKVSLMKAWLLTGSTGSA